MLALPHDLEAHCHWFTAGEQPSLTGEVPHPPQIESAVLGSGHACTTPGFELNAKHA